MLVSEFPKWNHHDRAMLWQCLASCYDNWLWHPAELTDGYPCQNPAQQSAYTSLWQLTSHAALYSPVYSNCVTAFKHNTCRPICVHCTAWMQYVHCVQSMFVLLLFVQKYRPTYYCNTKILNIIHAAILHHIYESQCSCTVVVKCLISYICYWVWN